MFIVRVFLLRSARPRSEPDRAVLQLRPKGPGSSVGVRDRTPTSHEYHDRSAPTARELGHVPRPHPRSQKPGGAGTPLVIAPVHQPGTPSYLALLEGDRRPASLSYSPVAYRTAPRLPQRWQAEQVTTTAPASTYALVIGVMATLVSFGVVVIFQPLWYWYLIPAALAIPVVVILTGRWLRRQRVKAEMRATIEQLG
jgi:hypothetical protein